MELDAFRPSVPIEDTHSIFIFSINDDRTSIKIKTEIDAAAIVGKDEIDEDFPYEILDNIEEELGCYPEYFVGAFSSEEKASENCKYIEIADCNSTKIVYDIINKDDIKDLEEFGVQGCDEAALKEICKLMTKNNTEELVK
jgi:hypothetical protein